MQTVCCLFGQQEVPRQEWGIIQKRLEREMKMLYGRGVTVFAAGSWSDFGWIAAATAIKLKGELPDVQLWLVPPRMPKKRWRIGRMCAISGRGWSNRRTVW